MMRRIANLGLCVALSACLAGCITPPPVIADKAPCSGLIADQLKDPVAGAPLPQLPDPTTAARNTEEYTIYLEDIADKWRLFGIQQTAAKRQEFEEKTIIIEGQIRCEERDAAAIEAARPRGLF